MGAPKLKPLPHHVLNIPLQITVEIGRSRIPLSEVLELGPGSVIELGSQAGAPLEIFVNGSRIGKGEAVVVNDRFGIRITELDSPVDRVKSLKEKK